MNAIIKAKLAAAEELLAGVKPASDWRANRQKQAIDWLSKNGAPHRRDHFWGYTDPERLLGKIGKGSAKLPSFVSDLKVEGKLLSETEFSGFGKLVERAHAKGARPMAEACIAQADGMVLRVSGDGGTLVLNRDEWDENFYLGVELLEGAALRVIETGEKAANLRSVFEVYAGRESKFDHIRISPALDDVYHAHIFAEVSEKADFRSYTLAGPSQFRRFETVIDLIGDEAHLSVAGSNLLLGECFHDDTVYVTHNAQNCTSRQIFKRVGKAGANSIFQGKIFVEEGAQKTDGYQISQGLLLEDGVEMLSKPELEIYADDVACSHGSTSSGLDSNSLFYLQSRGVKRDMAEKLLVRAFIEEAIEEIRDEDLSARVAQIAENWIFGTKL